MLARVNDCWASLYGERVLAYRAEQHLTVEPARDEVKRFAQDFLEPLVPKTLRRSRASKPVCQLVLVELENRHASDPMGAGGDTLGEAVGISVPAAVGVAVTGASWGINTCWVL